MNEPHQELPVLQGSTKRLAQVLAGAFAVLLTPAVFDLTRNPLLDYLARMYGPTIGKWLTLAAGLAEAFALYFGSVIGLSFGLSWFLAWLAARGLGR